MDNMGTITNHYYPYHDTQGAKIATKTRYTKLKEFSIQGNTKKILGCLVNIFFLKTNTV